MKTPFQELKDRWLEQSQKMDWDAVEQKSLDAQKWLMYRARRLPKIQRLDQLITNADRQRSYNVSIKGRIYMFNYNPKWKKILKIWDTFPVVVVVSLVKNGFIGLNLHYAPPWTRLYFMEYLNDFLHFNENRPINTKYRVDWESLLEGHKYDIAEQCVHRYLYSKIVRQPWLVPPEDWDMVTWIRAENFVKQHIPQRRDKLGRFVK